MKPVPCMALVSIVLVLSGCGSALGECDQERATQLVYGRFNLVLTGGQALVHDSCGNGVFCHSAGAEGDGRAGAPHGLDFDMAPDPDGWYELWSHRERAWEMVREGSMPPSGVGESTVADGQWHFDPARGESSGALPALETEAGKEIFRNWLACGLPTVEQTIQAEPGDGDSDSDGDGDGNGTPDWGPLHSDVIEPSCAIGGCHDGRTRAGELDMSSACDAYAGLLERGPCGEVRVVPGDAESLLVNKVREERPRCGMSMPIVAPLRAADVAAIREWVAAGAHASGCE